MPRQPLAAWERVVLVALVLAILAMVAGVLALPWLVSLG